MRSQQIPPACTASPSFDALLNTSILCPGSLAVSYMPCLRAPTGASCTDAGSECVWSVGRCTHVNLLVLNADQLAEFTVKLAAYHVDLFGDCAALGAFSSYNQACGAPGIDIVTQDHCADLGAPAGACRWAGGRCVTTPLALVRGAFRVNDSDASIQAANDCMGASPAPLCAQVGEAFQVSAALVARVAAGNFTAGGDAGSGNDGGLLESGVDSTTGGVGGVRVVHNGAATTMGARAAWVGLLLAAVLAV